MGVPAASAPFAGTNLMVLSAAIVGILFISLLLLAYYLFLTKCGFASWALAIDDDRDVAARPHHIVYSTAPPEGQAAARRGLEDAAIRRIPTFRYRKAQPAAASDCAVCLSEFREAERLRLLPSCLHAFHIDCIDAWLQAAASCPLCRAAVEDSAGVDIAAVLLARDTADAVVIDIETSPAHIGAGDVGRGIKMSMGDECIAPRREWELDGVQQPMRRSLSLDSCKDKHMYLALQSILRQHHSAVLAEDGKAETSAAAAAVLQGSSRSGRRLRRSFFSFSQSRSSRSAVLPV